MKHKSVLFVFLSVLALAVTALGAFAGPAAATSGHAAGLQQQVPTVAPPTRASTRIPGDDLANVKATKKIRVGTALDNPPFSYYREDNTPNGFDVALMDRVGRKLGVQAGFVDFAFDGLLDALQLGQVDAAIAAISLTPQRLAQVDFTNPYYVGEDGLLAAKSANLTVKSAQDLAKLRIGVQSGSVYQTYLKETLVDTGLMLPQNLMVYLQPEEMVRDLGAGNLDVAMMDLQPAQTFATKGDVKLVGRGLFPQVYSIAVRKGSSLLTELNKALAGLQADGTVADLAEIFLDVSGTDITPVATPSPMPTLAATPTPEPCKDGMAYVADLNYDDKNMKAPPVMSKGQKFTKVWRIRNSGTCSWTPDFALELRAWQHPRRPHGRAGYEDRPGGCPGADRRRECGPGRAAGLRRLPGLLADEECGGRPLRGDDLGGHPGACARDAHAAASAGRCQLHRRSQHN